MVPFFAQLRRFRLGAALALALCLALLGLALGLRSLLGLPKAQALRDYRPPQASRVLDRDGKLLARLAPEERIVVPLTAIAQRFQDAVLAIEDQRFFQHGGVDWRRVLGALWRDVQTRSLREGSSTITMQLARNIFPERLTRARTLRRKLAEVLVARNIEATFTKQQILALYLNQIYLGNGYYGVEAAARGYFGKPARDLSLPESALLAALPKAPSNYDPRRFPEAALERRNLVLGQMAIQNLITAKEEAAAKKARLHLRPPEEEGGAPWFVAAVRRQLVEQFGPSAETMGLQVHTTLDAGLQHLAEKELGRQLDAIEHGKLLRFAGKPCDGVAKDCLEGLFVALDAHTGDVRALVGGRDYELSEFDRVTQGRRQPGSTFKAFVWAAALQSGIPVSQLLDTSRPPPGGYDPADGPEAHDRPLNLREALRISSNRAAVSLGDRVGMQPILATARACGIASPIPDWPSTVLGAAEITPLELVAAFAPFANGGERVGPRFVEQVRSATGEVLLRVPLDHGPALSPAVSYLMASLLSDVARSGTGSAARKGLPDELAVLGKTGTTNAAQDVWFVGATPDLVAGVWMGFDHPRPIGKGASGGRLAAPVWGRVIGAWQRTRPIPLGWVPPMELEQHDIDSLTGQLATSACPEAQVAHEWFLQGTAPQATCSDHPDAEEGSLWDRTVGRLFR